MQNKFVVASFIWLIKSNSKSLDNQSHSLLRRVAGQDKPCIKPNCYGPLSPMVFIHKGGVDFWLSIRCCQSAKCVLVYLPLATVCCPDDGKTDAVRSVYWDLVLTTYWSSWINSIDDDSLVQNCVNKPRGIGPPILITTAVRPILEL